MRRGSLLAAFTMQDIGDKLLIKPREEVIFFLYRNQFWPTRLVLDLMAKAKLNYIDF